MDKYAFGNRLCALRTEKGYTQEKLGKMLGVGKTAVSKWENGTTQPRLPMLEKIAACFDITIEELLEYENKKADSSDALEKKVIQVELPSKILTIPRFSIKSFFGFSWLSIDAQMFIAEIKSEYGISNRKVADILQTSERKIGLWENGFKQPSPRDSLKIAALYYNNCKENEKANQFLNVSFETKHCDWLVKIAVLVLTAISLILYPQLIISESLSDLYINHSFGFHFSLLFSSLLPMAVLVIATHIFSKYINLNKPHITNTLKTYRLFICFYLVYLLISWFVFVPNDWVILLLILACGVVFFTLHYINFSNISFNLMTTIKFISFGIISLLLVFIIMFHTIDYAISMEDSVVWNVSRLALVFPILGFVVLCDHEMFYSNMLMFYKQVKSFFPEVKKEAVGLQKKDIAFMIVLIVVTVTFFIVSETNKGWIVEHF
ncbi:MAG: helix-turn-helix transcriptional regulator [Clostridia bacterium]|nr:helix-turn-helix transcriptional regulator [Clostridia bacterium]